MAATLDVQQKIDALQNALRSFKFNPKYFIHGINKGRNAKFLIMSKLDVYGYDTHSTPMSYDEMNAYLRGYNAAMDKLLDMVEVG